VVTLTAGKLRSVFHKLKPQAGGDAPAPAGHRQHSAVGGIHRQFTLLLLPSPLLPPLCPQLLLSPPLSH